MEILSYLESQIFIIINYALLCTLVGFFGIGANVVNLIVFHKQGFDSTINITLFAMSMSDLCGLVFQELFNVFVESLFEAIGIPMIPAELQHMIVGIPRFAFSKITCLITVYATLERCLCIAFPLHVKQMITPRRTAIVMVCIYTLTLISYSPLYYKASLQWGFDPAWNKTMLRQVYASGGLHLTGITYLLQTFVGFLAFVAIVVFTTVLIRKLGEKSTWRKSAIFDSDKAQLMSNREAKRIRMIALVACILIVCYTPSVILSCVTLIEPEFSISGRYVNVFLAMWSFSILFETVNGSVNIFLYFKMSTNYKNILVQILPCLGQ